YRTLEQFAAAPEPVIALLKTHLRPVAALDEAAVGKHLAALAAPQVAAREQAAAALERHGELLVPVLEKQLQESLPLEHKRRLHQLRERLDPEEPGAVILRGVRAVAVLERAATPAARQLLQEMAGGAPSARLTREAQAALKRLASPKLE